MIYYMMVYFMHTLIFTNLATSAKFRLLPLIALLLL